MKISSFITKKEEVIAFIPSQVRGKLRKFKGSMDCNYYKDSILLIPLKHWPQDVTPSHEVWRDFYTGEPAEPFLTAESIFYDKEKYLCMQTKKYWKSGKPSNLQVSCDTPDGDSCACQSDQQPPQLRLLGLCAQKSKSDTKGP